MFAKFDEIQSLPDQVIKENTNPRIGPDPLIFYYKCSSCGYQLSSIIRKKDLAKITYVFLRTSNCGKIDIAYNVSMLTQGQAHFN